MARNAPAVRDSHSVPVVSAIAIGEVVADITAAADHRSHFAMSPERNLIAAMLNLSREEAARVLGLVRASDFTDHLSKAVFLMIRVIVEQRGEQPTPQAVSALARGLSADLAPLMLSADRIDRWVFEVYTLGFPLTTWASARQVVEDSYRRELITTCTRIAQMGEAYASIPDLEKLVVHALPHWRSEHIRLATIARTDW